MKTAKLKTDLDSSSSYDDVGNSQEEHVPLQEKRADSGLSTLRDMQKDGGQGKREMKQPAREKNQEERHSVPG